jgi:hypothetical protein
MKSANTFNRKPPRAASASSMLLIKELYSRDYQTWADSSGLNLASLLIQKLVLVEVLFD